VRLDIARIRLRSQSVGGGRSLFGMTVANAGTSEAALVLAACDSSQDGLTAGEARDRLSLVGPNAIRTHHAQPLRVLARQLNSPVLILLAVTALISFFLGERTDTLVIGTILLASIGLGFLNEYRAERATEALHSQVTHTAVVQRDGARCKVDVITLVPGDIVHLALGESCPPTYGCSKPLACSAMKVS
jgi:Mg2+-importing ATPase